MVGDKYEVIWRPHWPVNMCPDGTHVMVQLNVLDKESVAQCANCYAWLEWDDIPAMMTMTARGAWLAKGHVN